MTEQLKDLPDGFKWQECAGIKAWVPMPEDWHYLAQAEPGTQAFFLTKERIVPGHREYQTGLALNAISRLGRARQLASSFAQRAIEMPKPGLEPVGERQIIDKHPLITFRQHFAYAGGELEGRDAYPMHMYWSATGNDRHNIAYIANFETPAAEWEQYQDVAKLMIEEMVLNPRTR
jgi:hypothetical protein